MPDGGCAVREDKLGVVGIAKGFPWGKLSAKQTDEGQVYASFPLVATHPSFASQMPPSLKGRLSEVPAIPQTPIYKFTPSNPVAFRAAYFPTPSAEETAYTEGNHDKGDKRMETRKRRREPERTGTAKHRPGPEWAALAAECAVRALMSAVLAAGERAGRLRPVLAGLSGRLRGGPGASAP